jgi:hypothetical protein
LPQQVEINKNRIERLLKNELSNHIVTTLTPARWEHYKSEVNGSLYKQYVTIDGITDKGLVLVVPLDVDTTKLSEFSSIVSVDSDNGKICIYSNMVILENIDVKIYYSKGDDCKCRD